MKIVVDVPDEEYDSYALAITFGMGSAAIRRILNGTPLPEGAEILTKEAYSDLCLRGCKSEEYDKAIDKMLSLINSGNRGSADYFIVDQIESIINQLRADKEYDVKAITRGNCMVCGKELTEGVFFCKECEEKGRKEGAEE